MQLKKYGLDQIEKKITQGERLSIEEGLQLYACPDPNIIGSLAHQVRTRLHGQQTSYVLNLQINYTNICVNNCSFCSYHRKENEEGAFCLDLEQVRKKVQGQGKITEIHIVGGCHPGLRLSFFEALLKMLREILPQATLKCFTAVEIAHFANLEGLSIQTVLQRLKKAGLDMLPGGGAEIFAPKVRKKICPQKITAKKWLEVCEQAHEMGIKTNCTMLFGHLEDQKDRLEHLDKLRRLQDKTQGFVCFIPLPFQVRNNQLTGITPITGLETLKTIAISRLMLDNIPHIKSYWVMLGLKLAQTALFFGADDLDGTVVEEKIGHMAGADSPQLLTKTELEEMIIGCGFQPVERNGKFQTIQ